MFTRVIYSALGRRIDRRPNVEAFRRSAQVLKKVARHAARLGVTVGIEPVNRYETFLVNTAEQARMQVEMIDEPDVGIHLDAYHMNIEEDHFYSALQGE